MKSAPKLALYICALILTILLMISLRTSTLMETTLGKLLIPKAPTKYSVAILTANTPPLQSISSNQTVDLMHLHEPYATLFYLNKKNYARFQGYTHLHAKIHPDEALERVGIEWAKVQLIDKFLPHYDWICWLDSDTLVVDKYMKLEDYIESSQADTDVILEGKWFWKETGGKSLKSGVILIRNSEWSRNFFHKLFKLRRARSFNQDLTNLDTALTHLMMQGNNSRHLRLTSLQSRANQYVVYLPKIGILHFSGCKHEDTTCIQEFDQVMYHLINLEQLWIYRISPIVQQVYQIFVVLYLPFALDRILYVVFYVWQKLFPLPPIKYKKYIEGIPSTYPMICVQLPMYNEDACCQTIIDCACDMKWPRTREIIQVVDDSTDPNTKRMIDLKAAEWKSKGVNIEVVRRTNRTGYKAGAMLEAIPSLKERDVKYIAIFDADFLPRRNFLIATVSALDCDDNAGFAQARWTYTNPDASLLTRMQHILLNFHFKCEQQVRYSYGQFFNFNGTAGVWRLSAIENSGGWNSDTLVEDLDLSLRSYIKGWRSIYLNDVECLNQIPPTLSGYRTQQRRWTSGPMQMLKKAAVIVYKSDLPLTKKFYCFWFFARNTIHVVNFIYFLWLIPLMVWVPRVTTFDWAVTLLPAVISATNIIFTPREWYHVVHFVIFENVMCLLKTISTTCGLFGWDNTWVVTPKFKVNKDGGSSFFSMDWFQFLPAETAMAIYLTGMGIGGLLLGHGKIATFCFFNGVGFMIVAMGRLGER